MLLRSVVDHVVCFTLNDLIPEEEEATLKAGWDLQFTCEPDISILSLSTGRLLNQNNRINCSHALFVRYPTWEDVGEYWNHPCKTTFAQAFIHRQLNVSRHRPNAPARVAISDYRIGC